MKKFATLTIAILLILAMTLTLTACGGNDAAPITTPLPTPETTPVSTPEPEQEEPEPEEEDEEEPEPEIEQHTYPAMGTIEGNVYISEYLGFQLTLPDGWENWDITAYHEAIANYVPEEIMDSIIDGYLPEDFFGYWYFTDFFANNPEVRSSLNINFKMLWEDQIGLSEIDYIEDQISGVNQLIHENYTPVFDPDQIPVRIGNMEWYIYKESSERQFDTGRMTSGSINYINLTNGYINQIILNLGLLPGSVDYWDIVGEEDLFSLFEISPLH